MLAMKHISLDKLYDYKEKLKQFSQLNEYNIRDIWRLVDDPFIENLNNLKYHWDMPLYQKIIFRYLNADRMASKLYRGLDCGNQRKLLDHFNMNWNEFHGIIEFFAWISNSLAVFEISQMECPEIKNYQKSQYVKKWKENDIHFFFDLPLDKQNHLIQRYNVECIDRFNEMMSDDIYYYT